MNIKTFFQQLCVIPFQTGFSIYIVLNGIISSHQDSAVFSDLYNLVGGYASLLLGFQIFAGISMLIGAGLANKAIETIGLIIAVMLFTLRAIVLVTDGDITLSDINAAMISIIILLSSITRLCMIYYAKSNRLAIWIKK